MTSSSSLASIDTNPQPRTKLTQKPRTSRRFSRDSSRTSVPPLTLSSNKVLQLTDFGPRFETALPEEHQQTNQSRAHSPVPSSYSESIYYLCDQPDTSLNTNKGESSNRPLSHLDIVQADESRWSSDDSLPNPEHADKGVLNPFYKLSDAISSMASLKNSKAQPKQTKQTEIVTLRDLLAEERTRQNERISQGFENLENQSEQAIPDAEVMNFTPRPLAIRPKRETKRLALDTKRSPLGNPRNLLERDIDELISSINEQTKLYNTLATPIYDETGLKREVPPPLKPKQKLFGTGNHPLKSPFPFRQTPDTLETVPETSSAERTFGDRLSVAMKNWPRSPTSSNNVISNGARRPSGPDTPHPNKSPFKGFFPAVETTMQKGGVHLQEAVAKAKKTVHFKTVDERKRESLKKSIAYIGISDQSPGMTSMHER